MRPFRRYSRALLIVLVFAVGLISVGLLFPACHILPDKRAACVQGWIQRKWYCALLRVLKVRVRRFGRVADEAMLWVGNHVSWLDIVVLGAQRPLTFVAKNEVGRWPIVGFMARRTGTLLVQRGDAASSRQTAEAMAWLLRQKRRIMLFPEGTSSNGDNVLRFHSRLFQPVTLVGGAVQAVAVAYRGEAAVLGPFVGEDEFLPHLWKLLLLPEIWVDVTFCEPVSAALGQRDVLARLTQQQVAEALGCGAAAYGGRRSRSGTG
ncbi:MAG: 1-acyl-sn-glycerol-3-phosphate acyltransferase [Methylotetracoccus sp.]|nr:1-acyl-sn-glycerol-3-phosphate acyltransferase [Methylotetracoccus sp.]